MTDSLPTKLQRPRKKAPPSPGALRNALLPMAIVAAFLGRYGLGLTFFPSVSLCVPFLVLFFVGPKWAMRSARAFDLDAVRLLSKGNPKALYPRYGRALALRLWGSPASRHQRRGWALFEAKRFKEAHAAYALALKGFENPRDVPQPVQVMAAHAAYYAGADELAAAAYTPLVDSKLPDVEVNLAHCLLRLGPARLAEAEALLEQAEATTDRERERRGLIRVLIQARKGRVSVARRQLTEVRARGEHVRELRSEAKRAIEDAQKRQRGKSERRKGRRKKPPNNA